jgi:hypothetical protein
LSQPIPPSVHPAASASAAPVVRAAIARAATSTGVDFNYLLAQARLESSLDPSARAGTSSAAGLYQFTRGTWLQTLDRHGGNHGLDWTSAAIEDGRVRDPALRQQIMALRFDPDASALMAAELASDNADHLSGVLGRAPDAAELYMAHFLGAGGAGQFLRALAEDPSQAAAALLPKAAAANRGIFYTAGGAPRSVSGVMELMRGKMQRAMGRDALEPLPPGSPSSPFTSGASWSAAGSMPGPEAVSAPSFQPGGSSRPSMAETLRETFALGSGDNSAAGQQVRAAYGKLKAFGL